MPVSWRRVFCALLVSLLLAAGLTAAVCPALAGPSRAETVSPPSRNLLEELHYVVHLMFFPEAVRAKITFEEVGPGRYRAEIQGRTQGLLALVTGNWRGFMSTEMELHEGSLRPLVYREFSERGGKGKLKEYRFDYEQHKVELYKAEKGRPPKKHWETRLNGPMYDPLTFYFNRRLTTNGLGLTGGENLRFQGIPYPKPDEIILRVGEKTPEGRKIMVELENRIFEGERTQVYAFLDPEGVPTRAYSYVLMFGKVDIQLLPGGRRLNREALLPLPRETRALMKH